MEIPDKELLHRLRRFKRWLVIVASICYASALALAVIGTLQHLPTVTHVSIASLFLGALLTGLILGLAVAKNIEVESIKNAKHQDD